MIKKINFDNSLQPPQTNNLSGNEFGLLVYDTFNIGDDIQSLAAMQFLPSLSAMVARDSLRSVENSVALNLIMNGWFMGRPSWPPAKCINPLFVSFHVGTYGYEGDNPKSWMLNKESISYLKQFEPIGCRDFETLGLLEERGVACYFSGCLTLTLEAIEDQKNRREILFVDTNLNETSLLNSVPEELRRNVSIITHATELGYAPDRRLKLGADLLSRYSKAHLVITSRLHCLLPCLAFGTPVLYVQPELELGRLSGYEGFFNILESTNGEVESSIDWVNPKPNPNLHVPLADAMRKNVSQFLANING